MYRTKLKQLLPLIIGLLGILLVGFSVPKAVRYWGRAGGQAANLTVDLSGFLGIMPTPWRNLAQGGEEPKAMLSGVTAEVKALRPEYIRLDHIYDAFKVVGKDGNTLTYNWSGLDAAVDEILATGAKPFLSLSYMPEAISKSDMVDLPRDWREWGEVVTATIEHFSGKNNRDLTGVIYEVWNEPDLFGGFKTYGDKNYLTMYKVSAEAAAKAKNANEYEFGGPAVTALYKNWLERLIKFVDENNLRMDFLSWHTYDVNLDRFEKDADQAREWASNIPALINLKFYITEWGHDSNNHEGYDNQFGAIHTIAASRMMMAKIQRAFIFEIKDGPGNEKYWNRWGLLTHEKFGPEEKKPRYKAVEFLNSLGIFRLGVSGEGSWVKAIASTDESGKVKLLVVNYDPEGEHSESVPITFDNLSSGSFKFSRSDFMGGERFIQVATSAAIWKTTEFFPPNSAAMFTLEF
ncbi:hypothetical protein HY333_00585 [Candidatus Collierbacteria bacterium]|nr:hypothetical protein [Candidatus Collierbacteria bacterium]